LDALSTYAVAVVGSVDGQPYEANWSFTTR
jgi:hypothetical protein